MLAAAAVLMHAVSCPCCRFMAMAASSAVGKAVVTELQAACALLPRRLSLTTKVLLATGGTSSIQAGLEQVRQDLRRKVGLLPQPAAGEQGQAAEQRSRGVVQKTDDAADSSSEDEPMPPSPPLPAPSIPPASPRHQLQQMSSRLQVARPPRSRRSSSQSCGSSLPPIKRSVADRAIELDPYGMATKQTIRQTGFVKKKGVYGNAGEREDVLRSLVTFIEAGFTVGDDGTGTASAVAVAACGQAQPHETSTTDIDSMVVSHAIDSISTTSSDEYGTTSDIAAPHQAIASTQTCASVETGHRIEDRSCPLPAGEEGYQPDIIQFASDSEAAQELQRIKAKHVEWAQAEEDYVANGHTYFCSDRSGFLSPRDAGILVGILASPQNAGAQQEAFKLLKCYEWDYQHLWWTKEDQESLAQSGMPNQLASMLASGDDGQQQQAFDILYNIPSCYNDDVLHSVLQCMASDNPQLREAATKVFKELCRTIFFDYSGSSGAVDIFMYEGIQQLALVLDSDDNIQAWNSIAYIQAWKAARHLEEIMPDLDPGETPDAFIDAIIKCNLLAKLCKTVDRFQELVDQWACGSKSALPHAFKTLVRDVCRAAVRVLSYFAQEVQSDEFDIEEFDAINTVSAQATPLVCQWLQHWSRQGHTLPLTLTNSYCMKFAREDMATILGGLMYTAPTSRATYEAQQLLVRLYTEGLRVRATDTSSASNDEQQTKAESKPDAEYVASSLDGSECEGSVGQQTYSDSDSEPENVVDDGLMPWASKIALSIITKLCTQDQKFCQSFAELIPPSNYMTYMLTTPEFLASGRALDLFAGLNLMFVILESQAGYIDSFCQEPGVAQKLVDLLQDSVEPGLDAIYQHMMSFVTWLITRLILHLCADRYEQHCDSALELADNGVVPAAADMLPHTQSIHVGAPHTNALVDNGVLDAAGVGVLPWDQHVQQVIMALPIMKSLIEGIKSPEFSIRGSLDCAYYTLLACCSSVTLDQERKAALEEIAPDMMAVLRQAPSHHRNKSCCIVRSAGKLLVRLHDSSHKALVGTSLRPMAC